ncbi:MAG: YqeG family HAD IIIA-type phosphatase [Actinobacteria bacterium]|nr:YqeG family HAD IIIA-type phosphatase [Actinomycetota bacterium]|tara:strand:- start:29 stop:565 length:537 start_codon:yes stop_codon:yes gene_type:complete
MGRIETCLAILRRLFLPSDMVEVVTQIDFESLWEDGVRTVCFDVDNTLMKHTEHRVSLEFQTLIERLKRMGFVVYLVSNNSSYKRIHRVCEQLDIKGLYFACKPFVFNVAQFARRYEIELPKTVFVGDQLLTDVLLANWLRSYSILVNPLDMKLSFIKFVQREFEQFLMARLGQSVAN